MHALGILLSSNTTASVTVSLNPNTPFSMLRWTRLCNQRTLAWPKRFGRDYHSFSLKGRINPFEAPQRETIWSWRLDCCPNKGCSTARASHAIDCQPCSGGFLCWPVFATNWPNIGMTPYTHQPIWLSCTGPTGGRASRRWPHNPTGIGRSHRVVGDGNPVLEVPSLISGRLFTSVTQCDTASNINQR